LPSNDTVLVSLTTEGTAVAPGMRRKIGFSLSTKKKAADRSAALDPCDPARLA